MGATRVLALAPLTAVALLGVVWAVHGLFFPPFTDQQIRESFVDTGEPSAWVTFLALAVLGAISLISLLAMPFTRQRATRIMTLVTLLLAISAGLIAYRNHVVLTERTTALTGQTFGRFHGLL